MAAVMDMPAASRLRDQADRLMRRALSLAREADTLRAEALELRSDANKLDNSKPRDVAEPVQPERETPTETVQEFMGHVCDVLAASHGADMDVIAISGHLACSAIRARTALERLVIVGLVERGRGKTYRLAPDVQPEPETEPEAPASASLSPDGMTLHTYTMTTPERELLDRRVAYTTAAPAELPSGATSEAPE